MCGKYAETLALPTVTNRNFPEAPDGSMVSRSTSGPPDAPDRYPADDRFSRRRTRRVVGMEQLRSDRPGCHRIDRDAVAGKLEGPGTRQPHQTSLGNRVSAATLFAQGGLTGKIDDAAPATSAHARNAGLGYGHGRQNVDVELPLQSLRGDFVQELHFSDADIVYQRLDFSLRIDRI